MPAHACALTREHYRGWKALRLANGCVEIFVVPEIGGRIIQLRFAGTDFLYVNPRHAGRIYSPEENCQAAGWKNYGGSKVWPAPQGWLTRDQWPGPPDPVLDGGPYAWRALEESPHSVALRLESQPDEATGIAFSRVLRVSAGESAVRIVHRMTNISDRRVRWAIWQVTQQDAAAPLTVHAPARRVRQIYGDQAFAGARCADNNERGWTFQHRGAPAKYALEMERGIISCNRRSVRLIEEFPIFPDKPYPDGAQAEIWVNGEGSYTIETPAGPRRIETARDPGGSDAFIETEALSPLVELSPGEEYEFPVTWRLEEAAGSTDL